MPVPCILRKHRDYGKISAGRLFYLHGQGDTRAQPAAALMDNFTFGGCSAALVECYDWRYPIRTAP